MAPPPTPDPATPTRTPHAKEKQRVRVLMQQRGDSMTRIAHLEDALEAATGDPTFSSSRGNRAAEPESPGYEAVTPGGVEATRREAMAKAEAIELARQVEALQAALRACREGLGEKERELAETERALREKEKTLQEARELNSTAEQDLVAHLQELELEKAIRIRARARVR